MSELEFHATLYAFAVGIAVLVRLVIKRKKIVRGARHNAIVREANMYRKPALPTVEIWARVPGRVLAPELTCSWDEVRDRDREII